MHNVRRVILFMEAEQILSDAFFLQGFEVAAHESMHCWFRMRGFEDYGHSAPCIILKTHIVFGVDSFHFFICWIFTEKRAYKELRKPIESTLESFIWNIEMVVCHCHTCVCVRAATIVFDVLSVIVLWRVLFTAHEEHVFQEVCRPIEFMGIWCSTNSWHIEWCTTLICLVVLNQDTLHFVLQCDIFVESLITFWCDDFARSWHWCCSCFYHCRVWASKGFEIQSKKFFWL